MEITSSAGLVSLGRPGGGHSAALLCLPFAGGGSTFFRPWVKLLPPHVGAFGLTLPGREHRFNEAPLHDFQAALTALENEVLPNTTGSFVLFGHSMGALLAFELARRMGRYQGVEPAAVIVSGQVAPHLESRLELPRGASLAEIKAFLVQLSDLGEASFEDDGMLELVAAPLRSDIEICRSYRFRQGVELSCPMWAFGGLDDEYVSEGELSAWRCHTTGEFVMQRFEGGHFFLRDSAAFQSVLAARLGALLQPPDARTTRRSLSTNGRPRQ